MPSFDKHPSVTVWGEDPFNAEPALHLLRESPETPVEAFYVRNHGSVPELDTAGYRLRVHGMVERPLELSLDDLAGRFSRREIVATLQCAGNRRSGLVKVKDIPGEIPWGAGTLGNGRWTGTPLAEVIEAAGPLPGARHAAFVGSDTVDHDGKTVSFGGSVPLEKALAPEVLLASELNGDPLPIIHGAPLRVVVPGYLGARSVKWLAEIVLREEPSDNPFQATEYRLYPPHVSGEEEADRSQSLMLGELSVNAAIWEPLDDETVPAGTVVVSGWAMAGGANWVVRVDLSTDGGETWIDAPLLDDQGRWAWRRWHGELELGPGEHEIVARAVESSSNSQPERASSIWNFQGYANNAWARIRVQAE